jgi:hypothetical protein
MRYTRGSLIAAALLLVGCGDSNSPSRGTAGTYSYVTSDLTNAGYAGACEFGPTTITFARSDDSLGGTLGPTALICTPNGGLPDTIIGIDDGLSVRGIVTGENEFSFEIDGDYWVHEGVRQGDEIGGTISVTTGLITGTDAEFVGTWTGERD